MSGKDSDDIPANCPSSQDLRTISSWLLSQYPVTDALDMIRARDYPLAHELAGVHDAIEAISTLADNLDEAQKDEDAKTDQGVTL